MTKVEMNSIAEIMRYAIVLGGLLYVIWLLVKEKKDDDDDEDNHIGGTKTGGEDSLPFQPANPSGLGFAFANCQTFFHWCGR